MPTMDMIVRELRTKTSRNRGCYRLLASVSAWMQNTKYLGRATFCKQLLVTGEGLG